MGPGYTTVPVKIASAAPWNRRACSRKDCHRPRWLHFRKCRRHVLYQRKWRAQKRTPVERANLVARVRLANRLAASRRRQRERPHRRRYRCGVCHQLGHNAQACRQTLRGLVARLALGRGG